MAEPINTVPQPAFGPTGFIAPSEKDAVLPAVKSDVDVILGGGVNTDDTTPQGQLAVSIAASIGNANDVFIKYTQQVDPAYSEGRMQDGIGRIYFISRIGAEPTVVTGTCLGIAGLTIAAGSLAEDVSGNLYVNLANATIGAGGTVSAEFAAVVPGPTPCPAGTLTTIYQALNGWDSIINPADGVLGRATETRAEFEDRRRLSVEHNAQGSLPAILGAVLTTDGVTDAFVAENVNQTPQAIRGFILGPNSIYVAAVGGLDTDVARALWTKKSPGCGYNGNTTVVVEDTSPVYNPPFPSYTVKFERPLPVTVTFVVTVATSRFVPANAVALVQAAIVAAFNGQDGGPRARIGSTIFASRFYGAVTMLGSWVQVINIKIGCSNTPSAIFTGSISGTVLTVSALASGVIATGQQITGDGVIPGTIILSGSGSTWAVSNTQTAASGTMQTVVSTSDEVLIDIDQSPVTDAGNTVVVLT